MREYPNLIGERFGKLTVIEQVASDKCGNRKWRCLCDCGGEHITTTGNLRSGRATNCGCINASKKARLDITGQRWGRLVAIKHVGYVEKRMAIA